MKRYLLSLSLFFACTASYAQSLSFGELQNMTNMTIDQVHNFLLISKGFKSLGKQVTNGQGYELFKSNRTDRQKTETVALGTSYPGISGNVSRKVIYSSMRFQDINSILLQAKRSTMSMVFEGSDRYKNIYRFDNSLFMSIISLGFDQKSGTVQVQEK
jgi:hypothetical protein